MKLLLRQGVSWAACAVLATSVQAAEVRLRLLETTDVHMHLLNYDYYQDRPTEQFGLAKTATLIAAARAENPNSLLFDNGDLLQGNPLGDVVAKVKPLAPGQVHPAYRVMNQLGYDAANIGNHDFNFGLDFLRQALRGAQFPVVSANVYVDDGAGKPGRHAFTPYVILQRSVVDTAGQLHTLKVGVLGLVPPQIMQWDKANLTGKVVPRDMVAVARELVPQMRAQGAQLVVLLPHTGLDKGETPPLAENAAEGLARVPGVDAILFGHAHAEFPGPTFAGYPGVDLAKGHIHGVPAVMPGKWGDHLGVVDLLLQVDEQGQWRVAASQASLRSVNPRGGPAVAADPALAQAVAAEHADTLAYVRQRIADSAVPLNSYFSEVADDASIQVVADAQRDYVRQQLRGTPYQDLPVLSATAPFKSGGSQGWSYYTDMPAGPLAIKNAADLYLYPNTLKALLVTGAQLREWLDMSAGRFRRIDPQGPAEQEVLDPAYFSFNFDIVDGVSYAFDLTQPPRYDAKGGLRDARASRVRELRFQGQPVGDAQRFVIATNNYRAGGGGNFPGVAQLPVVLDAAIENREVLIAYLKAAGQPLRPAADGNWRILPVPGVSLGFLSGAAGARFARPTGPVRWLRDNGDGSAWYELLP